MTSFPEGNALIYCEGAFGTTNGKTAHGLVRRTSRYHILSVIDSKLGGNDSGLALEEKPNGIFIHSDLFSAFDAANRASTPATHFVVGLAPDGGRLAPEHRTTLFEAIRLGLNIDSGLHDFFSEDPEIMALAAKFGVRIRDVRKPPPRNELHFFSGIIERVKSLKIAVLGTDSAVGKRTTAWIIVDALQTAGFSAELIGTGQTTWMQGVRYGIILDSLINDFVSGEIEHIVWTAWVESHPDVLVIEGQGSLMNPAYPGGFEILAAGRPDVVVLQLVPARKDYDGFPGYPIHPIDKQIEAIELISGKPVVALTINHENLSKEEVPSVCSDIHKQTGLPATDLLLSGPEEVIAALMPYLKR